MVSCHYIRPLAAGLARPTNLAHVAARPSGMRVLRAPQRLMYFYYIDADDDSRWRWFRRPSRMVCHVVGSFVHSFARSLVSLRMFVRSLAAAAAAAAFARTFFSSVRLGLTLSLTD